MKKQLLLKFSRDSRLPCELKEIVGYIFRRKLSQSEQGKKIGLAKDIWVIPLNQGYIICAKNEDKNTVLYMDNIDLLYRLNGRFSFAELNTQPETQLLIEQLHYYKLLSFGFSKGILKAPKVDLEYYRKRYQGGNFVFFSMIPLAVELNITNTCNFNCIHCSKNSKPIKFSDELSTDEILSIIDECAEVGVPELRFMGGEPLIHPGFLKFLKRAKEKGIFQLRLSTNGWWVDEDMAKELSRYFESIQVSIHGASPDVHDRIVGKKGAWEQARKAVNFFNKSGVKVNVGFSVMRENINDVFRMQKLALEWGIDSLGFLCLVPQGRGAQLRSWSIEEILSIGDRIKTLQCKSDNCLNFDVAGFPPLTSIKKDAFVYGCEAGKTLITIEPNGIIKACGLLSENLGLQKKEKLLLEIWHSPQFIKLRKQSNCKDCNYRQVCWGPCHFLRIKEKGGD